MKYNFKSFAVFSLLLINSVIFSRTENDPQKDSLNQIMSFINENSKQAAPIFDLTVKPQFDQVNGALGKIISKAAHDKKFYHDQTDENTELSAYQQQNILKHLYESRPDLFLSASELKDLGKTLSILQDDPTKKELLEPKSAYPEDLNAYTPEQTDKSTYDQEIFYDVTNKSNFNNNTPDFANDNTPDFANDNTPDFANDNDPESAYDY